MSVAKALAEMIGTFAIIFVGGGSIFLSERFPSAVPAWVIPFAFGLTVIGMILAVGPVSGAHFNPAVTLAFAVAKRLPLSLVWVYWSSQLAGGVLAMTLLLELRKI